MVLLQRECRLSLGCFFELRFKNYSNMAEDLHKVISVVFSAANKSHSGVVNYLFGDILLFISKTHIKTLLLATCQCSQNQKCNNYLL